MTTGFKTFRGIRFAFSSYVRHSLPNFATKRRRYRFLASNAAEVLRCFRVCGQNSRILWAYFISCMWAEFTDIFGRIQGYFALNCVLSIAACTLLFALCKHPQHHSIRDTNVAVNFGAEAAGGVSRSVNWDILTVFLWEILYSRSPRLACAVYRGIFHLPGTISFQFGGKLFQVEWSQH